ncbi:glycosyltransferase family 4 protein [Pseudotabrizicola alkalilacus]|uniref:Colanic acid biosynthesis glycosyltransferase WcaL n=1 Tax=Pseudotabrizicola alkalilacus TaxID=2305252 RepID=A0A411Z8A4_9RHOB|nr:glycosyltransferase family 4 protein [Pseudotabrizicola alkalilacus]RGP39281.1 colanic acid biosynthesis glycosyltransferase WcaL [Pseudotabrizicola alkalilacus]
MKIAYLVNTYPRGSQTFIRREILALERLGWDIHRFALRSDRAALVDPADMAEDARTEHILELGAAKLALSALDWMVRHPKGAAHAFVMALRCGTAGAGKTPGTGGWLRHLIYLAEAAHLARRCHDLRLPHLHAHFGTNSAIVAMLSSMMGGPGYSFTVHGPEEFDAPRALSLGAKCDQAVFAVAISSFGRSQLYRWAAPATWPRLHVVHCGIEPWRFPDPTPMPQGGPHLVAIGRLSEQKGFALLIEAMARAAPSLPGLHLTLVGDGELRPQIEAAIARHDLSRHVTLTGWLDEARVREALSAAQALIVPSFAEGLPVVIMEAMAAGRPVIATAIAGVPELVTPETGWLVPAGDASALAQAIGDIAVTPVDRLAQMGHAARQRVLDRHDINREAEKLTVLFASKGNP